MHNASSFVIDYCLKNKIATIVIGLNDDWKQQLNIGKKNNQMFISIPFKKFIDQIQYKAEDYVFETQPYIYHCHIYLCKTF